MRTTRAIVHVINSKTTSDSGRSFNDDVAEFNARYGDAVSESSDEQQLGIAIKEALKGRKMTKDLPRKLVIRPDSEDEEEVDSAEPRIEDDKQEKLEKMLEQELARVEPMDPKNVDDRFISDEDDFVKQDRADIRARIEELMQQKARSKNDDDLCEVSCYSLDHPHVLEN